MAHGAYRRIQTEVTIGGTGNAQLVQRVHGGRRLHRSDGGRAEWRWRSASPRHGRVQRVSVVPAVRERIKVTIGASLLAAHA